MPSEQTPIIPVDFTPIDLPLDSQLGAFLCVPPGEQRVQVTTPGLLFLDITAGPDLRVLDLTAVVAPLHLTISNCPHLEEVYVSASDLGTTIHMDFALRLPQLRVYGAVADMDAGWWDPPPGGGWPAAGAPAHATCLPRARARRPVRDGLWLGPCTAGDLPDAELVILLRGTTMNTLHIPANSRCRELMVQDVQDLQLLTLANQLDALEVRACASLGRVQTAAHLRRARFEGCGALEQISGSGTTLALAKRSGAPLLAIADLWNLVRLTESPSAVIQAPLVPEMDVLACWQLLEVKMLYGAVLRCAGVPLLKSVDGPTQLDIDPNAAFDALRAAVANNPKICAALLSGVTSAKGTKHTLRSLQILAEIARAGAPLADVWAARQNMRHRHSPQSDWHWQFPSDLGDRGWMADVRLWLLCRKHADALAFEPIMRRGHDPAQLAAVARTLQGAEDPAIRKLLAGILRDQLNYGAMHGASLYKGVAYNYGGARYTPAADGIESNIEQRLAAVLRTCVQLRAEPLMPDLMEALCGWVVRCLPCAEGLQLLAALRTLGLAQAAHELARFAADPKLADELRRLAAALLLGGGDFDSEDLLGGDDDDYLEPADTSELAPNNEENDA